MARSSGRGRRKDEELQTHAVVIFVDIRGFSNWFESIEAHSLARPFISDFLKVVRRCFRGFSFKGLGNGAMLVRPMTPRQDTINPLIVSILHSISEVGDTFERHRKEMEVVSGNPTPLSLGWGITRGTVIPFTPTDNAKDFLGATVNRASRLCDLAHPNGIVIDRNSFPNDPSAGELVFFPQTLKLFKPPREIDVWVSAGIYREFQARESLRETPEVHVAGVCIKHNGERLEILVARRNDDRALFPGKLEGCGGQLRRSESFQDGVMRHYKTEMGIEVTVVKDIPPELYLIERPASPIVPGLRFLCVHVSGEPKSPNHSAIWWVTQDEFIKIPNEEFIEGVKDSFVRLIQKYNFGIWAPRRYKPSIIRSAKAATSRPDCGGRSNFRPLRRHRMQASSTDGSKGRKVLNPYLL
jgi:hypothetical protein